MKIQGRVIGYSKGVSKSGKNFCIGFVAYKDNNVVGEKVADVFIPDNILSAIDDRKLVGSKCELNGGYNKNGEYKMYLDSISA